MRLIPLLVLLVVVLGVVGTTAVAARRPAQRREATVAEAVRHAGRISAAALVVGVLAALAAGHAANDSQVTGESLAGRTGTAAISALLGFGLAHTGTVLVGELTWPRPTGTVRRARLVRRGLLDSVPRWLLRLSGAAFGTGLALVLAGAVLAGPDGRSITVSAAGGAVSGAAAPFAGVDYGLPTGAGLVCLALLTAGALWAVAARPALGTADERVENALRRASAHRVLRGTTSSALAAVGGLLTVSGLSIRDAATGALDAAAVDGLEVGTAIVVVPWLGGLLALVGVLGGLAGLALFAARAPRPPVDAPALVEG